MKMAFIINEMTMRKKVFNMALLLAFVLTFVSLPITAFATSTEEPEIQKETLSSDAIEKELRAEGATEETISHLIGKLERGEVWDSFNPKYNNLKPQIVEEGYSKTTYPDGSMMVLRCHEIRPEASLRAIKSVKKYKAELNGFAMKMSFCINARRDTTKKLAIIDSQYNKEIKIYGGSFTEDTIGFVKGWKKQPNAWYAIYYKAPGDIGSKRVWVKAHVNSEKVWTELSTY